MSSGRKRGKEWSEVIVEGENISCSHCHEVLSKKIERVRNHLSKCAQYQKSQEVGSGSNNQNSLENEMFEEFMPSKVQKIDQFISKTSDKEREKLDKQIGRAFFANNFSFQSIENSEFDKAIQMLRTLQVSIPHNFTGWMDDQTALLSSQLCLNRKVV